MTQSIIFALPSLYDEIATAENLRKVPGIYSAFLVHRWRIQISYNSKKLRLKDVEREVKKAKCIRVEDPEALKPRPYYQRKSKSNPIKSNHDRKTGN